MKIKAILFILLLVLPSLCFAQGYEPFSARVRLDVGGDENLKNKILIYISHELQSLGDVVVTDNKCEWIIEIIAIEATIKGGSKIGVAFSLVVSEVFDDTLILPLIPNEVRKYVSLYTSYFHKVVHHQLRVDSMDGLQRVCEEFVADFESQILKPAREDHQREIESIIIPEGKKI